MNHPSVSVAMALRGTIFGEIAKYHTRYDDFSSAHSKVCTKLTASTFKALLVADEDAYNEYKKIVADATQALDEEGLELVFDKREQESTDQFIAELESERREAEGRCPQCGTPFGDMDYCFNCEIEESTYPSSDYREEQEAQSREKARSRVTQSVMEVSAEFAAHEDLEQYSSAITVSVAIGFAASEVLIQKSYEEYRVSRAVFDEFLVSTTAAVEEARAYYKERHKPRILNPQELCADDDLPF